jgi:ketosteroid isomerase-like protein
VNDVDEIRRLIARYAQLADDGDALGRSELFTDDALYVPTTGRFVGRAAIRAAIDDRLASQPSDRRTRRLCANPIISIDGDSAEAATDFVLFTRVDDEPWTIDLVGRYHDRFVRRHGGWLYSENHPRPLPNPLAAPSSG